MTQKFTEKHRFLFSMQTKQPKFNLCKSVRFCVFCVLLAHFYISTLKKYRKTLANSKIMRTFAPVFEKHLLNTTKDGPFVYRLGRKIFILERGVRFSHGLLHQTTSAKAEKKDGPFVYRLGRKIFILERGVRFSHGLPEKSYLRNRVTLFLFSDIFITFVKQANEKEIRI